MRTQRGIGVRWRLWVLTADDDDDDAMLLGCELDFGLCCRL